MTLKKLENVSDIIMSLKRDWGWFSINPMEAMIPMTAIASVKIKTGHLGFMNFTPANSIPTTVPPKTQQYGESASNWAVEKFNSSG
jgi:hypothetical protein